MIIQIFINGIIAGAAYSLVAVGFNLIYGATRFFNLAHGAAILIGGYTVFYLISGQQVPTSIAILFGIFCALFFGFLIDRLIFRPLRRKAASNMALLVASLGSFTVIQALISIIFTSQFNTFPNLLAVPTTYHPFGATITDTHLITMAAAIIAIAALSLMLERTKFGSIVRAVSDDAEAAKTIGIDCDKIISYLFIIGSALAGLAGILVSYDVGIEPGLGFSLLLKGIIAAIIGGIGSFYGGALGAVFLGLVENFGIWKIDGEWKDAIAFGLLIIFLIFRPQGIIKK
jgi:branched-chain amino acid transport system permease protein